MRSIFLGLAAACALSPAIAQNNYQPDPAFGTNGVFKKPAAGQSGIICDAGVLPSGKILAAGAHFNAAGTSIDSTMMIRLKPNGTPDSTFGTNGYKVLPLPASILVLFDLAITPAGKVGVLTQNFNTATSHYTASVFVCDEDGNIDNTFNGGTVDIHEMPGYDVFFTSCAFQSDGKLMLAGCYNTTDYTVTGSIWRRYNTDGTLDATFGTGGEIIHTGYFSDYVTIDASDRIYVDLSSSTNPSLYTLMRLKSNGDADSTYGTNGVADTFTEVSVLQYAALTMLDNGRIVGGTIQNGNLPNQYLNTYCWDTNGHRYALYGTNGESHILMGGFDVKPRYSIAANGNKTIINYQQPNPSTGIQTNVLMQFDETGEIDSAFGTNGSLRTDAAPALNMFNIARQPDASLLTCGWAPASTGVLIRYVQTPQGIQVLNNQLAARVFPNPATDRLTLDCLAGTQYALYDLSGKELMRGRCTQARTSIGLEALPAGTYSLVCTNGQSNACLKVAKQ